MFELMKNQIRHWVIYPLVRLAGRYIPALRAESNEDFLELDREVKRLMTLPQGTEWGEK